MQTDKANTNDKVLAVVDDLTDPVTIQRAVEAAQRDALNAIQHDRLAKDDAAQKLLRRAGVPQDRTRPVQDIMLDAARATMRKQFADMRASGKALIQAKEYGATRITASGAVYVAAAGKNGKTGPWVRVHGRAAEDIKRMAANDGQ